MSDQRSTTLERGPSGIIHDTLGGEATGVAAAGVTALAYYLSAVNRGDPEPHKALIPGIKMGLLIGSIPYVAGAIAGSTTGYPSTNYMNSMEERDWPSYLVPGRAGYRSGKRTRYLMEIARRNKEELEAMKKPREAQMAGIETLIHPNLV